MRKEEKMDLVFTSFAATPLFKVDWKVHRAGTYWLGSFIPWMAFAATFQSVFVVAVWVLSVIPIFYVSMNWKGSLWRRVTWRIIDGGFPRWIPRTIIFILVWIMWIVPYALFAAPATNPIIALLNITMLFLTLYEAWFISRVLVPKPEDEQYLPGI